MESTPPCGLILAIAIDVLPQQGQFLISALDEFFTFCLNALWWARNLLSARIRDNAIGAKLIASPNDRYMGFDCVIPRSDEVIEVFFKSIVCFGDLLLRIEHLIE